MIIPIEAHFKVLEEIHQSLIWIEGLATRQMEVSVIVES